MDVFDTEPYLEVDEAGVAGRIELDPPVLGSGGVCMGIIHLVSRDHNIGSFIWFWTIKITN